MRRDSTHEEAAWRFPFPHEDSDTSLINFKSVYSMNSYETHMNAATEADTISNQSRKWANQWIGYPCVLAITEGETRRWTSRGGPPDRLVCYALPVATDGRHFKCHAGSAQFYHQVTFKDACQLQ